MATYVQVQLSAVTVPYSYTSTVLQYRQVSKLRNVFLDFDTPQPPDQSLVTSVSKSSNTPQALETPQATVRTYPTGTGPGTGTDSYGTGIATHNYPSHRRRIFLHSKKMICHHHLRDQHGAALAFSQRVYHTGSAINHNQSINRLNSHATKTASMLETARLTSSVPNL